MGFKFSSQCVDV